MKFTTNFNNKLYCKAFIVLRPGSYRLGDVHDIYLNADFIGKAEIIDIKPVNVDKLNNFMAFIDSGYNATECRDIISKMYKDKLIIINCMLLVYHGKPHREIKVRYTYELKSGKKVKETFNLNALESGMPEIIKHNYEQSGDPVIAISSRELI